VWRGCVAGGNGGLSIRNHAAMVKCARDWYQKQRYYSEDNYFTDCVMEAERLGTRRVCRRPDAETFSVETIYYPTPWYVLARPRVPHLPIMQSCDCVMIFN
jgi:hypothetical protein